MNAVLSKVNKMAPSISKFRGTLVGVLVGDSCGLPYENDDHVKLHVLKRNLDKLEGPYYKAPYMQYSDDTAMTKHLADTLIEPTPFNQSKLAINFTRGYFEQPWRGYGPSIGEVFHKLKVEILKTKGAELADPTGPARAQFMGGGSFGNGGAMRIAPAALYCWNHLEELPKLVTQCTEVTHTHHLGVNGAILQAYAIHRALNAHHEEDKIEVNQFTDYLIEKMEKIEADSTDPIEGNKKFYQSQLTRMKGLLAKEPTIDEVVNTLGHSVAALFSVPTAIYAFLRSQKPEYSGSPSQGFRNTLEYAISLGGDTDTIASMACAIAGAYYGDEAISSNLIKHVESVESLQDYGEKLYEKTNNPTGQLFQ